MALEAIAYPLLIGVAGGIGSAVIGAYRAVGDKGEDFDRKHFVMSIPRAIVGAVLALGVAGGTWDVNTLAGVLGIFAIGATSNSVLGKLFGNSDKVE